MLETVVDTSGFETAVLEFASLTRKQLAGVMKEQAGILVGNVIAITPPAGRNGTETERGGIALDAKKRGEASIAADISKLFPTSNVSFERLRGMVADGMEFKVGKGSKDVVRDVAETIEDIRRIHQLARNPNTGRTRKGKGAAMAVTHSNLLRRYIKQQQAKVGLLNSGWVRAARELKTANRAIPAWITRHGSSPGGANISEARGMVAIRIFNEQAWFPKGMQDRVESALRRREKGIYKAMEAILERRARAAERRMGR